MAVMSNVMSVYAIVSLNFMFSISRFKTIICRKAKNTMQFLINYYCNVCDVFVRLDSSPNM